MLNRFYCTRGAFGSAVWLPIGILIMLSACGGGSSSSKNTSSASSPAATASSSTSNIPGEEVVLAGRVTYDLVPHNESHIGLNYGATASKPVRGAVTELLNANGTVIATGKTDNNGDYLLRAPKDTLVRVRVKAEVVQTASPSWDFKVTDNTSNNAVYALTGSLANSGSGASQRNLHAGSGWDGSQYSATRAAAPFAILDNIYNAVTRLTMAGNLIDLNPLELRWSTRNNTANGDLARGEVGTSYYDGNDNAIYILGDANNDADEYDSHVIAHEWGHYLEQNLFRSDSLGGNHTQGDILDMRVSLSEGFANGFASILLDDPYYADSFGAAQAQGFYIDVAKRDNNVKGFYSEGSIGAIFYNYYRSANNKAADDFSPLLKVLSHNSYIGNDAMTSIFLFYERLNALLPQQAIEFGTLMQEQNIFGGEEYAQAETNDAGYAAGLPLYKALQPDAAVVNVCSSARFGKYNKYANSQLLKLTITQAGSYAFSLVKDGGALVASRPEILVYKQGSPIKYFPNMLTGIVSGNVTLSVGTYIVEAYDANNRNEANTQQNTTCFNIQVVTQ